MSLPRRVASRSSWVHGVWAAAYRTPAVTINATAAKVGMRVVIGRGNRLGFEDREDARACWRPVYTTSAGFVKRVGPSPSAHPSSSGNAGACAAHDLLFGARRVRGARDPKSAARPLLVARHRASERRSDTGRFRILRVGDRRAGSEGRGLAPGVPPPSVGAEPPSVAAAVPGVSPGRTPVSPP